MSTTDWNTVTLDLQRAANNLAWFVLESMIIPGQPPPILTAIAATTTEDVEEVKQKQVDKQPKGTKKKMAIGKAVDRLISDTLT